jgi:hypothetical protein
MKKFTILMIVFAIASITTFSQTVQEKLDKQHNDPKTRENAARADVYVSKNKSIFDSTTIKANENTKVVKAAKKKKCRKKG